MNTTLEAGRGIREILEVPERTGYSSPADLDDLLQTERRQFEAALGLKFSELSDALVDEIRVRFSGRKSPLQEWLKSLKNLAATDRKAAGAKINDLKVFIETELQLFLARYQDEAENAKLAREHDDVTLPLPELALGSRHPVSATMDLLTDCLRRMGFVVVDGPEIDHDFFNFEALNQPSDHPAREMHDTMFLASEWLLRSHTSNVQAHALLERSLPLKIICPGYVYRKDYDLTHVPCFRQMECLVVDKGINMGHLRYTINTFLSEVFGRPVKTRLRSSYFPFTEPSAEMDVECQQCFGKGCRTCKGTGWTELGGCGIVNRNVFKACGIDPDVYSGFAFGFGVDRIAMSKYGLGDLRSLFEGDLSLYKNIRV